MPTKDEILEEERSLARRLAPYLVHAMLLCLTGGGGAIYGASQAEPASVETVQALEARVVVLEAESKKLGQDLAVLTHRVTEAETQAKELDGVARKAPLFDKELRELRNLAEQNKKDLGGHERAINAIRTWAAENP